MLTLYEDYMSPFPFKIISMFFELLPCLGELKRVLLGLDGHLHLPDVVLLLLYLLLGLTRINLFSNISDYLFS